MAAAIATAPAPVVSSPAHLHWPQMQQFMLRHTGNVLRDDQAYLMESRLQRVCKSLGFASLGDLVTAACASLAPANVVNAVIEALTTHETSFFRDISYWRTLQSEVLPALIERARTGRAVRVWCAACSTGQEPYSLAMLLAELAPQQTSRFEIIATDIAQPTLDHARNGFFTSLEVNRGLDIKRLSTHFTQATGGFRIKEPLIRMIHWKPHNLLGNNMDPQSCDVVMCRNVLIYFNETDRAMAFNRLMRATVTDGHIGIGSTESAREPNLKSLSAGLYQKLK